ncbi:MAG: amidohydrolase family protein [Betaproteobacteria bacterium]
MNRRDFVSGAAGLCFACIGAGAKGFSFGLDEGASLMNPCSAPLPAALMEHELVKTAFAGLNPGLIWDGHAHLLGTGDSGSGCWINPQMESLFHPMQVVQKKFFLNAACVEEKQQRVDRDFVARLGRLIGEFPVGAGTLLFAFDHTYREDGQLDRPRAAFYVPNRYAANVAKANPGRFRFVASVHPYRKDAIEELERCAGEGAVAVKWLPSSMGIDPGSARCDAFYEALVKHDLPLITHAGQERATKGAHQQQFGNPLRLRRPLDHGVRVVVAHCGSMGEDRDIDRGAGGEGGPYVESFELFARLMAESRYEKNLFGDISAVPQSNRARYLPAIISRSEWHPRLLNGSDYPLPGVMPLFSVDTLARNGWLQSPEAAVIKQLRDYNPLMFDFVLKRSLRIQGAKLSDTIFETGNFFDRHARSRRAGPHVNNANNVTTAQGGPRV